MTEIKIPQNEENVQYDFRKIIVEKDEKKRKRKGENKENQLFSNLQEQFRERNLKLVNVRGDGNYFFRGIVHQLYGDESQHQKVREEAVQEVIKNQIDIETLLQEVSINTFQAYQQIENKLSILLYK